MKADLQRVILATLDTQLPALVTAQKSAGTPSGGWLRAVRQALGLAQATVAKNTGISQQAYAQFERGEASGTLSLGNLHRAAAAMDCELVYFLVPRDGRFISFTELAAQHDPDFVHLQASEHSMALEDQAVGDLPKPKPNTPKS